MELTVFSELGAVNELNRCFYLFFASIPAHVFGMNDANFRSHMLYGELETQLPQVYHLNILSQYLRRHGKKWIWLWGKFISAHDDKREEKNDADDVGCELVKDMLSVN